MEERDACRKLIPGGVVHEEAASSTMQKASNEITKQGGKGEWADIGVMDGSDDERVEEYEDDDTDFDGTCIEDQD